MRVPKGLLSVTHRSDALSWPCLLRDCGVRATAAWRAVPRVLTMLHIPRVGALHCSHHAFRPTCPVALLLLLHGSGFA